MNKRIAIIRIRSGLKAKEQVEDTMKMLRLYKVNTCVVVPNTPNMVGMIEKIKDYVTWGEIDDKTMKQLLVKRGKLPGNKPITEEYIKEKTKMSSDDFVKAFMDFKKELKEIAGIKTFFRLNPPAKGFDRNGIKKTFVQGGVLGYRKDQINELLMRMI
ncbi:MAG: 50S ribosomal protein L30 [Candidatus Nanoarchaeia archaeon]|nr:50S ribosomal protein L30 [Candidatus Nanoarchaeia archaeon]